MSSVDERTHLLAGGRRKLGVSGRGSGFPDLVFRRNVSNKPPVAEPTAEPNQPEELVLTSRCIRASSYLQPDLNHGVKSRSWRPRIGGVVWLGPPLKGCEPLLSARTAGRAAPERTSES